MAADILMHRSDAELPTARGLRKTKMTKMGLGKFLTAILAIVHGTTRFYEFFMSIENLKLRNGQGILNSAPNLIPAASGFGGVSNHAVFAKYAFDAAHALPQFVVRQLIGFRGNY